MENRIDECRLGLLASTCRRPPRGPPNSDSGSSRGRCLSSAEPRRVAAQTSGQFDRCVEQGVGHPRDHVFRKANLRARDSQRASQRVRRSEDRYGKGCDVRFRSEEHTSELQSLMRISYDVFCLKKKKNKKYEPTK